MKIRAQDASGLATLVEFLRRCGFVAVGVGPNTIEVSRLSSVRHDLMRLELDLFLEAWHLAHPEARAQFVE
jgi:hypothetical protein